MVLNTHIQLCHILTPPSFLLLFHCISVLQVTESWAGPGDEASAIQSAYVFFAFPPKNICSFLIGQSAGGADQGASKSPWVYVTIDGVLQSCRLFVYNVGNHDNNKAL